MAFSLISFPTGLVQVNSSRSSNSANLGGVGFSGRGGVLPREPRSQGDTAVVWLVKGISISSNWNVFLTHCEHRSFQSTWVIDWRNTSPEKDILLFPGSFLQGSFFFFF